MFQEKSKNNTVRDRDERNHLEGEEDNIDRWLAFMGKGCSKHTEKMKRKRSQRAKKNREKKKRKVGKKGS